MKTGGYLTIKENKVDVSSELEEAAQFKIGVKNPLCLQTTEFRTNLEFVEGGYLDYKSEEATGVYTYTPNIGNQKSNAFSMQIPNELELQEIRFCWAANHYLTKSLADLKQGMTKGLKASIPRNKNNLAWVLQ